MHASAPSLCTPPHRRTLSGLDGGWIHISLTIWTKFGTMLPVPGFLQIASILVFHHSSASSFFSCFPTLYSHSCNCRLLNTVAMIKLQKRTRSEVYLPVALQLRTTSMSDLSPPVSSKRASSRSPKSSSAEAQHAPQPPLSPFQKTHRRIVSTPQTQWPLISTSSTPGITHPASTPHDASECGPDCRRCGKKRLIQLNSPASANIPKPAASLRPVPQAHMRAVSDGIVTARSNPKRLSITTTATALAPAKPISCHKCGKQRRPVSFPVKASSSSQRPSTSKPQDQGSRNYQVLRSQISGTAAGTPYPSNNSQSRPTSPTSPEQPNITTNQFDPHNETPIISPLSPRRNAKAKVDFAPLSCKSNSSGSASPPYSPLTPTPYSPAEVGTGRLINMISTAIRESSPPYNNPAGGLGVSCGATESEAERFARARSPVDAKVPFEPVELDSVPVDDCNVANEIINSYGEEGAEFSYDWTDAVPVIRLPSVREGIGRFKSLRGGSGGSQRVRRGPSVRERFGSLRGHGNGSGRVGMQQQQGWYGGLSRTESNTKYQALGAGVEMRGY